MAIRIKRTHFKGPLSSGNNFVPPLVDPTLTPTSRTFGAGTITLVAADLNAITNNTGATTGIVLVLPSATGAGSDNTSLKLQLTVASQVMVVPASGQSIYLGGSGTANEVLVIPGVVGNYADLYCDGATWMVLGYTGAVIKQA